MIFAANVYYLFAWQQNSGGADPNTLPAIFFAGLTISFASCH
jgi:hypothetical protein